MQTLQLNFRILQWIGMWRPLAWSTGWKLVVYNCFSAFMISSLYLFAVSQFVDLIVTSESANEFSHGSLFLAILAGCGKSASVMIHRKEIIYLANVLRNDLCRPRNEVEVKIQTDCERDARFNAFWYSALGGTTVSLITLRSLIVDIPARIMPFKGWLPYGLESLEVGFWVAYFHQLIAHATGAAVNSTFDTLVPGFMMQTCAQMKILKYRIETLPQIVLARRTLQGDEDYGEALRERQCLESELLVECIRHHVQIFQFADTLNDIFSNVVFLQFALSTIILCVSAYETSGMKLFSPECTALIMYLCCMLTQIFIYCFYGGELTLQSVDICNAVYRMDQSVLTVRTKKNLILIMMRALHPIVFTCGNIITVSLDSFTSLIKLSYSVYNVLQR
ncbi:odorant receptor 46a-like [Venturia canescens]|uniref:odorant receptor 46a-like n=1 Tax=Venturia canescens TaxID=32260 RepID=UPI001C9C87C8|nr:odorant receptor 46a-like [Venturia canescens]